MPRYESRVWRADPTVPGSKSERRSFRYLAFVPDPIANLSFAIEAESVTAITTAERAVAELNQQPPTMGTLEVLARRLLRAESIASSRIEGLVLSQRRLARAEAEGADSRDQTAYSVVENVHAMEHAISLGAQAFPLTVRDVLDIHRFLISGTNAPAQAGQIRDEQNWIGGNEFNPANADFVPPPPELVKPLLADLVRFANRTDLPPAIQAAIVHAQFETIHPFSDGNGRVGRALIHVILRKRGLTPHYVPPVSLVLAADARSYVEGLTAYRAGKLEDWCCQFSRALNRAASKAVELDGRVRALQDSWRSRMGPLRSDASAEKLIQKLPAYPTITVSIAAELLGRSKQAANQAVIALAEARVLKATTLAKRNRAWEATELFDLINELERELAIPAGETRPVRAAPRPGPRRT